MLVAIDFDGVVTENETLWAGFIEACTLYHDYDVCIVTQNYPDERPDIQEFADELDIPVFYTMSYKKDEWMQSHLGRQPDIVIDDQPGAWVSDSWA